MILVKEDFVGMNMLASFRNRTQALQFANQLKGMGVSIKIINTPREISTSCGLSIMFGVNSINRARVVINSNRFTSFMGFYLKKNNGRMYTYEKTN